MSTKARLILMMTLMGFTSIGFAQRSEQQLGKDVDEIPLILASWDSSTAIHEHSLNKIAKYFSVDNYWLIAPVDDGIRVEWATSLVSITNEFTVRTASNGILANGIWWNTSNQPAFLRIGTAEPLFEMSPNSMIFIRRGSEYDALTDDQEIVMLGGAARNDREFSDLMRTDPNVISLIRSEADWYDFISDTGQAGHPLAGLSPRSLEIITGCFKFNNGGLAGANIEVLKKHLSSEQIQEMFRLFGLDILSTLQNQDYRNYECDSPGNCRKNSCCICTSNC
jgi:hypothetical protein